MKIEEAETQALLVVDTELDFDSLLVAGMEMPGNFHIKDLSEEALHQIVGTIFAVPELSGYYLPDSDTFYMDAITPILDQMLTTRKEQLSPGSVWLIGPMTGGFQWTCIKKGKS